MTKKAVQLAFLSLESSKKGVKISFITAESCDRAKGQFSREILSLQRNCAVLFSTLPKEQTLTKEVALPKIRQTARMKLAETLLCSGGLFERGSLAFAFCDGPKTNHLFCVRSQAIEEYLTLCRKTVAIPTGLTMPGIALVNFARFICHIEEGSLLHLSDDEGLFVQMVQGELKSAHAFSYEARSNESLAAQLRTFLGHQEKVETIWTTGPGALDLGLTNYLQAALGLAFQRPSLEQAKASSHLCHTFALAIGCALEGSKHPADQVNFRTGRFASQRMLVRSMVQEGLVALHVAAALFSAYFLGQTWLNRDLGQDEIILNQRVAALEKTTARLPHALRYKRAGEQIAQLDPKAESFCYE